MEERLLSSKVAGLSDKRYKILVIDDEKHARMVLEDFLNDAGFDVLTAENGREGLDVIEQDHPDVVLTDIRMPVMDGLAVVEAMQNLAPLTPAIIISGVGTMDNVITAMRLGAWDYLLKPIRDLEILKQIIQRSLERASHLHYEKNYQSHLEEEVREKTACLKAAIFAKESAQRQAEHEAYHDSLTQMGNRLLCIKELGKIHACGREDYCTGFLYFDIQSLKNINDAYGYSFGDTLLIYLVDRLYSSVPEDSRIYRMGGDEFSVSLDGSREEIIALAESICEAIKEPYQIGHETLRAKFTFGLTLTSNPAAIPEKIITEATFAHLQAKRSHTDNIVIYDDNLHQQHLRRLFLEKEMPGALPKGEFFMVFQPILNLQTRSLYGFEGLLRWNNPREGVVGPEEFILLAEDNGFIVELGEWVMDHACRFWKESGLAEKDLVLSVNISGKQFRQQGLVSRFHRIIEEAGLASERLCLEITESALMTHVEETARKLGDFRRRRIRIGIDDFGTGYSSLKYLSEFPVDCIKIDMSYVQKMEDNPKSYELIKIMTRIAGVFGLDLVAEGVETPAQRDLLQQVGCFLQQGFLYSKPLPESEVLRFCEHLPSCF